MMSSFPLSAAALATVFFLSGCAAIKPMDLDPKLPASPAATQKLAEGLAGWDEPPVITEGVASVVLITPTAIPESIKARKVDMELEPGVRISDLVAILGRLGVPTIIADDTAASRTFYLPRYSGTLGGLVSAVSRTTNTWFTWHEGTLVVSAAEKISVSIPQESDFAEELRTGLTGLGLSGSAVSWQAGMATMEVTPQQFAKVRTYLERFTSNAAVVTMQLAIINVTLKHDARQGIDWDKLTIASQPQGTPEDLARWRGGPTPPTPTPTPTPTPGTGTGGSTGGTGSDGAAVVEEVAQASAALARSATGIGTALRGGASTSAGTTGAASQALFRATEGTSATSAMVTALSLASGNLSAAVFLNRFSFEGMFGFLEKYGITETKQNVMLKTIAGSKVEFASVTQVPYVSQVSVTSSTTAATTATGSTQTAQAEDGIRVELSPTYDAAANSVSVDLSLSIKSVLAFNELSAGNQIGTLTQPTTAERSFNDKIRVRPGQTVVVGGITYDTVGDERGAPLYMRGTRLESQVLKVQRNTTFIVLRPTVARLGQILSAESGQSLDLLPVAPDPDPAKTAVKKGAK